MFKPNDPYTHTLYGTLIDPNAQSGNQEIGLVTVQYHVMYYNNVQLLSGAINQGVATPTTREYVVTCSQRITLFNSAGVDLGPMSTITAFENYPALIQSTFNVNLSKGQVSHLLDYSPKTVNSQVQTTVSAGQSDGSDNSSSTSKTSGSSTSNTNSYSTSVGLQGDIFSVGGSYDHSSTSTHDNSATKSSVVGTHSGKNSSASASMSVKDWSVYAYVNPSNNSTTWNFSQSYPWNVLEYRSVISNSENHLGQNQLQVPSSALALLYQDQIVFPPSELSMFGINFVTQSQEKIIVDNDSTSQIMFNHDLLLYRASHSLQSSNVAVYMDSEPTQLMLESGDGSIAATLDLPVLALHPLNPEIAPAIVGFVPSKFSVQPGAKTANSAVTGKQISQPPTPFMIYSDGNNLQIKDTTQYPTTNCDGGFQSTRTALIANLGKTCSTLSMSVLFKVTDSVSDYTLFLKQWKTSSTAIKLEFIVNGDSDNIITKYVDANEAEGGEGNLLGITLRNRDFSSVEYDDRLNLGLNSIDIVISSTDTEEMSGYALRALSIESV